MSAVAARKAALAAKLATEGLNPSVVSSPMSTPPPAASPAPAAGEVVDEIPQASSSKATTPSRKSAKKSSPRRSGRDAGKKDVQVEKTAHQRYHEEPTAGEKRKNGEKRITRAYEEAVEQGKSPPFAASVDQDERSRSHSEDDEEIDFSALELLQTITNGRPKKKRRISR